MRPFIYFFLLFQTFLPAGLSSQVVIDQSDMPDAGDTLRLSMTSIVPANYYKTGRDTTWDFSMLEAMNQRVDTFVAASSTPPGYWLISLVSNLASPQGNSEFFPGLPVTQSFIFYKKSSDAFVDNGFAFNIQGVAVPAKYDIPDKYYAFPLDTNATWASSSLVTLEFPGMFYFSSQRTRSSFADGWGTVITPFGSFESIRVRCDLTQHDSIFITSMGFGVGMDRNITEYKWMAENMGIPVLQINSEGPFSTATYRDSTRLQIGSFSVSLGLDTTIDRGATITLHAVVTGGAPPYRFIWSTLDTTQSLTVSPDSTTTYGIVVIDGLNKFASDQKLVTVVSPGIDERKTLPLEIFPNPSTGRFNISSPNGFRSGLLVVHDRSGRELLKQNLDEPADILETDLSLFPAGLYIIRLITGGKGYQAKVLLTK